MNKLNPRQREAIKATTNPVLVLAGAGSGKTAVITHKIAWLIEQGLEPDRIAAVTFTNKAAREMRARITKMLKPGIAAKLNINTFHTLGLSIIRAEREQLGLKSNFSIFDSEDTAGIVRELMRTDHTDDKKLFDQVRYRISEWKNALITPEAAINGPADAGAAEAIRQLALRVYPEYERHLRAYNGVDFDDLISLPVALLKDPDTRLKWQGRIQYLLVDEYQDTNLAQYELVKLIVGDSGALTVVGDDDQSIYTWRGANPENLKLLKDDFPSLELVKLEQNYRSTGRILKAANTLIANNPHVFEKRLWSELGYGDPIRVIQTGDEAREAERIAGEIQHHRFKHRTRFADFAILMRSNFQARIFERVLREQRIPYFLSGGSSYFDRTEIKDVLAYLRLIVNPDDDAAFLRIVNTPRREIGPATLEKLGGYAARRSKSLLAAASEMGLEQELNARQITRLRHFTDWLDELHRAAMDEDADTHALIERILEETDYANWLRETSGNAKAAEKRLTNVLEFTDWLKSLATREEEELTLAELVAKICLIGLLEKDGEEDEADHVALMTMHAAKGLEFPHVFIAGFEENLLPHANALEDDALTEERRLAYVGITRAQKTLTLTYASKRKKAGEIIDCLPSRFLEELPQDELVIEGKGHERPLEERQARGREYLSSLRDMLGEE